MESTAVLNAGVDALLADSAGPARSGCSVLDLGGGTGGQAVRLASLGHDVTVVDPSLDALAALARRASDAGVADDKLRRIQGDAESLGEVIEAATIDLVLCHGVLEVVDDPRQALDGIHQVLRPGGRLSLLIHQREAAVLARVATGQVRAAAAILTNDSGSWGAGDPLRRRFSGVAAAAMLDAAGFEVVATEGVRMFVGLAPDIAIVNDPALGQVLVEMESVAATIPALRDVANELHLHARRS